MNNLISHTLRRTFSAFGLLALLTAPLAGQLDPRLQKGVTDFLDLYQQSSTLRVKPEIATVFDFSGSMQALMHHPEYVNKDLTDSDTRASMTFALTGSADSRIVTAKLAYGSSITIGGVKAPAFTLTSTQLIRPDGSLVTEANVKANTVTTNGLYGETLKEADVRNWVRAASHVRFLYAPSGHTVDLPIPWKIMNSSSTGYPLSSFTVVDSITKTNADGTTATYGSGGAIEMDRNYLIQNNSGARVLSGGTTGTISTTFQQCDYQQFYIYWVLTAKAASGKFITFDSADASLSEGQSSLAWGQGFGTFVAGQEASAARVIPARNRVQGVKEAAIRTWIKYQKDVFWAFRFLDEINESSDDTATTIDNNSRNNVTAADPTTTFVAGRDTGWTVLNKDSVGGMKRIASFFADTWTPLAFATSRTLAQFNDPGNIFTDVETGADAPLQCMRHFFILFTDGLPTKDRSSAAKTDTPYIDTSGGNIGSAANGNKLLKAPGALANLNTNQPWWNLFTFAGLAAHGVDSTLPDFFTAPTASSITGTPDRFVPFAVTQRGSVIFKKAHPIQTMTVGVSLGGTYSDPSGPKRRLFLAAAIGDPDVKTWDLSKLTPFTLADPNDPTKGKTSNSINFFDATNPDLLTKALDYAFLASQLASNQSSTSTPAIPFVGLGLGTQIYLGKFKPPEGGGPIWPGDLFMFPTRQVNGQTVILDKTGNTATSLDGTTAMWSASTALFSNRPWNQRKIWTRLPGTASVPDPPLVPFKSKPTSGSTAEFDAIKAYVATSKTTDADKNAVIQYVMGADTSKVLLPNRDTIMGDVINSAPSAIEYTLTSTVKSNLPPVLFAAANANPDPRFRVIFVGTNQGMLHAFGEISWVDSAIPSKPLTRGVVDELWAFIPKDFLANLDYLDPLSKMPHRFLVDGTPSVYHLDIPATTALAGNGTVDSTEFARVIFGLRKGGRSYYALNIADPFTPTMGWALVPDESAFIPNGNIEFTDPVKARSVIQNLGFSTSTLAVGTVAYGSPAVKLHDALFLGGGLSTPEVDGQFAPAGTKLGRSALAVDAINGHILMAWDFKSGDNAQPTMGPVSSGLVPFEYFLNSGLVQRAYFTDYNGGLWALGSGQTTTASDGKDYRRDNSSLDRWTIDGNVGSKASVRKIYTGDTNDYISTQPAAFLTGNVPYSAGIIPVGVAFVTGDRNNPLDYNYTPATAPLRHKLAVVFDYQDATTSASPFTSSQLYNVPDTPAAGVRPAEVIPGSSSFYLANNKRGYQVQFAPKTGTKIPKGINEPLVLGGALFFSYFSPLSVDPCAGGAGETNANRICDVLFPVYQGNTTTVSNLYGGTCESGRVFVWTGVATNFSARSTVSVNQGGVVSVGGATPPGADPNKIELQTIFGQVKDRLPRPRTWRTVR